MVSMRFLAWSSMTVMSGRLVMYSRVEVAACAKRVNRSAPTVWRWIKEGCRIDDAASLEAFRIQMKRKKTNIAKARERRGKEQKAPAAGQSVRPGVHIVPPGAFEPNGNGDPPVDRRGAPATLLRLEFQEASAYSRLEAALARGNSLRSMPRKLTGCELPRR
jgi:hypothetical protein